VESIVSHDQHFLTRIERLEGAHAELALALYYDSSLVRYVLSQVELPDAAERVALSLDDPEQGPFIIVARDGGFVTCLGAGMRPGADKPVVTRQRLDAIAGRIEALRRAMDEAESSTTRCRRLVRHVLEAGDRLTREDFQQLSRLTPLLSGYYFQALVSSLDNSLNAYARVERARRFTAPRHAKALRYYWSSTWSMAHFSLLLAADGPRIFDELFAALEMRAPEYVGARSKLLPWALVRLGVTSFAARGAWVASKLPRTLLPDLKQSWLAPGSANCVLSFGLGLCAIGMRHRRLRAEVHKVLSRPAQAEEAPLPAALRKVLASGYELGIEAPEPLREQVFALAREFLDRMGKRMGPAAKQWFDHVPDDIAVTTLLSLPLDLHADNTGVLHLIGWLPWLVKAEAADFYLPAAYIGLRERKWTASEAAVLVEPRRNHDHPRGITSIDVGEPQRKRPCPCGSGKKYKRCCGAASGEAPPE
jgi:SEC-C motif